MDRPADSPGRRSAAAPPTLTDEPPPAAGAVSSSGTSVWAVPPSGAPVAGGEPATPPEPVEADFADEEPDDSLLDVAGPDVAESDPPAGAGSSDPRVLTIRASRATPLVGEGEPEAEVVLPANRPPLRPARPAAQPRRRRFGRTPS